MFEAHEYGTVDSCLTTEIAQRYFRRCYPKGYWYPSRILNLMSQQYLCIVSQTGHLSFQQLRNLFKMHFSPALVLSSALLALTETARATGLYGKNSDVIQVDGKSFNKKIKLGDKASIVE